MGHSATSIEIAAIEAGILNGEMRKTFLTLFRGVPEIRGLFSKPPSSEKSCEKMSQAYSEFIRGYNLGDRAISRFLTPETKLPEDFIDLAISLGFKPQIRTISGAWQYLHILFQEEQVQGVYEYPEFSTPQIALTTVHLVQKALDHIPPKNMHSLYEQVVILHHIFGGNLRSILGNDEKQRLAYLLDRVVRNIQNISPSFFLDQERIRDDVERISLEILTQIEK